MKPLRLLLVDDHLLMRQGLAALLCGYSTLSLVGQAATNAGALEILAREAVDVVITDIGLEQSNGIDLIRHARAAGYAGHFVMLTAHDSPLAVTEAFAAGAAAYVLKDDAFVELIKIITRVNNGETGLVSRRLSKEKIASFGRLSSREREVLRFIAVGLSNKQIGMELHLSTKTVETYRARLMEKLHAHKCTDLVREALRAGFSDRANE